jgi:methylmalonyl-CoA mutase N-terminal domain/subunit
MARTINHIGLKIEGLVPFLSALVKGTDENKLVKMSASFIVVATAAENDEFIGIVRVIDGDDKAASVQVDGAVRMGYDSNHAPSVGWNCLQAGGADGTPTYTVATCVKKVTAVAGTVERLVTEVDTANKMVTFLL